MTSLMAVPTVRPCPVCRGMSRVVAMKKPPSMMRAACICRPPLLIVSYSALTQFAELMERRSNRTGHAGFRQSFISGDLCNGFSFGQIHPDPAVLSGGQKGLHLGYALLAQSLPSGFDFISQKLTEICILRRLHRTCCAYVFVQRNPVVVVAAPLAFRLIVVLIGPLFPAEKFFLTGKVCAGEPDASIHTYVDDAIFLALILRVFAFLIEHACPPFQFRG